MHENKILVSTSFKKMIKYKKYKDLYDIHSIQCIVAIFFSILVLVPVFFLIKYNGMQEFTEKVSSMIMSIVGALIGLLGFIVTGLAVLTGAISSKVVKIINKAGKQENLEKLLLSFYFLGMILGISIITLISSYLITILNIKICYVALIILLFVNSYLLLFIIFYSINLIGNSIEIFYIINDIEDSLDKTNNSNNVNSTYLKNKYNGYRITALEVLILSKMGEKEVSNYIKIIREQIDCDKSITEEERIEISKMFSEHFNND